MHAARIGLNQLLCLIKFFFLMILLVLRLYICVFILNVLEFRDVWDRKDLDLVVFAAVVKVK